MRISLRLLPFVLLFAGFATAADLSKVSRDAAAAFETLATSRSAGAGTFADFAVAVSDSTAGDTARYATSFTVIDGKWLAYHLDGFVFSFPDGFDISHATVAALTDDNPAVSYAVNDISITGQVVAIELRRSWTGDSEGKSASSIAFTLTLAGIRNTETAGTYQIAGLAFDVSDDVLAGPALSQMFHIVPGAITGLTVRPESDQTVAAGGIINFTAYMTDEFGNPTQAITPIWSLTDDSDPIGTVYNTDGQNGTFLATTVGTGRVMATYNNVTATSGLITVTPGALSRIDLVMNNRQLVGTPLLGPATVTFYDNYGNRKTDLDLSATPLRIITDDGRLIPDTISDNSDLINGSVDLAALGLTYRGSTALTGVSAAVGWLMSNQVDVSFSGYDILGLLDASGQPLTTVYEGVSSPIGVVVQNNGLTNPSGPVTLTGRYDGVAGTAAMEFTGGSNGATDTVLLYLPAHPATPSSDVVRVLLSAPFALSGQNFTVTDSASADVSVGPAAQLQLVSEIIGPDTVYPGQPFLLNLGIDAAGISDTGMTATLAVLIVTPGTTSGRTVYYSIALPAKPSADGIISYQSLFAQLNDPLPAGDFAYFVSYELHAGGTTYVLHAQANPVTVLQQVDLTYAPGTLMPSSAAAGYPVGFAFDMNLNSGYPVAFDGTASALTITAPGFTASSSLIGPDTLYPGPNHLRAQEIYIPEILNGQSLTLAASFNLTVPTVSGPITTTTSFDNTTVPVTEQPVAQIVDLQIVAPNAPKVNISQPFQAKCIVANLSSTEVAPFDLRLESNGGSTFDTLKTTPAIPPHDTIEVLFNCVAAAVPNPAELFRVSLPAGSGQFLDPINNIAIVTIQTPAELQFTYTLFGAPGGLVDQGAGFGLTVEIMNVGEASASDGTYLLTTDGVDFGLNDSTVGTITVDRHIEFQFVAPAFDTLADIIFQLTGVPLDLNTGQPAMIDSTSITIPIKVQTQDADLLVEAVPLGSNLVSPGQTKDLFRLDLTNRGVSSLTAIRLKSFAMALRARDNQPLSVSAYIDPSGTSVSEQGTEVPTTVSAEEKLLVEFPDFIIESGETRSIILTASFRQEISGEFTLSFESDDISAVFSGGSQDGRPVRVASASGSPFLLSRAYVVRGHTLSESFVIQDNPFNPNSQPARFSYELPEASGVEFRVFTLTGEEVYAHDIPENSSGVAGVEQEVTWDGRNGSGRMVANGVYIVSIKIVSTGEQARIKVAVVK